MLRPHALLFAVVVASSCQTPLEQCLTSCSGCCSPDGTCAAGSETTACGAAGQRCSACVLGLQCVANQCKPASTGGGAGGGGGSMTGGGGGSTVLVGPDGCLTGLINCGSECVHTSSDPMNCGVCGRACGAGQICRGGACGDDSCISISCPVGYFCQASGSTCLPGCQNDGQCARPNTQCNTGTKRCVCEPGTHDCGGQCVSDNVVTSCGDRCTACPSVAGGTATCVNEQCSATCAAGSNFCNGLCVAESPQQCGAACRSCPGATNASPTCTQGVCGVQCRPGFHDCGGQCVSDSSPATCGTSCTACPVPLFASAASCTAQQCGGVCVAGTTACGSGCCRQRTTLSTLGNDTCAVTPSGTVRCYGSSHARAGVTFGTNIVSIDSACALSASGEMRCPDSAVTVVPLPLPAVSIAGDSTVCAVLTDGAVYCRGDNSFGQLGDGTTTHSTTPVRVSGISDAVAVTSRLWSVCVLTRGGAVKCWGHNAYGQLGDGTTTNRLTPVQVSGLSSGVVSLAMGWSDACALLGTGAVRCWGRNEQGAVGDGTTTSRSVPTQVTGLTSGVTAISVGVSSSCAVAAGGALKCWGANYSGQLGNGTTQDALTPTQVTGLGSGVVEVSAANTSHACAKLNDGSLRCWGENGNEQLGDGTTQDSTTPVTVANWP